MGKLEKAQKRAEKRHALKIKKYKEEARESLSIIFRLFLAGSAFASLIALYCMLFSEFTVSILVEKNNSKNLLFHLCLLENSLMSIFEIMAIAFWVDSIFVSIIKVIVNKKRKIINWKKIIKKGVTCIIILFAILIPFILKEMPTYTELSIINGPVFLEP